MVRMKGFIFKEIDDLVIDSLELLHLYPFLLVVLFPFKQHLNLTNPLIPKYLLVLLHDNR
jgi:phospholipid/cholesterol/gamma-HCH transport system permease protein